MAPILLIENKEDNALFRCLKLHVMQVYCYVSLEEERHRFCETEGEEGSEDHVREGKHRSSGEGNTDGGRRQTKSGSRD